MDGNADPIEDSLLWPSRERHASDGMSGRGRGRVRAPHLAEPVSRSEQIHGWAPSRQSVGLTVSDFHDPAERREQNRRLHRFQLQGRAIDAVTEYDDRGRLTAVWDQTALIDGERHFLETRRAGTLGGRRIVAAWRSGDVVQRRKVEARLLARASYLPERLAQHLQAAIGGRPKLLWTLLVLFAGAKEPEYDVARRIVEVGPKWIRFTWVVWLDGKTAFEFSDEVFSIDTVDFQMDFDWGRLADGLSALERVAKLEYYVLSTVAGGWKSLAEGAVKKGSRIALRKVVLGGATRLFRRRLLWVVQNLKAIVGSAITKSAFAAGGSWYATLETERQKRILAKAGDPKSTTALTHRELEGLAEQAFATAVTRFVTTLVGECLTAGVSRKLDADYADLVSDAQRQGLAAEIHVAMRKAVESKVRKALRSEPANLLPASVGAGWAKAVESGEWNAAAFDEGFRDGFAKQLTGLLEPVLAAPGDAALDAFAGELAPSDASLL